MQSSIRRSINLNLLNDIQINRKDILLKWCRGLSIVIIILSVSFYFLKLIFINITNDTFSLKTDTFDFPSTDNINNSYSFNSSFLNNEINENKVINDSIFILDMKYFNRYINSFNLTEYNINKKRRSKEMDYIYRLYRFNYSGKESPILIDYTSSLPHYPLFSEKYQKCFIRGEIISLLNDINNLSCVDISGINYTNNDFILRLSLLDKNSNDIKLFILKEINIKKELDKNNGIRNVIIYANDNMNNNLRYCSNDFSYLANYYKNLPKNYLLVMDINWNNKTQYFCLRNISLIYN